ncbi:MAG TPA: glycolate oxidase subunit GlcF [Thiobacillaceae bacterium]|nr:glycolate oxidase subunit GlcF [Thiobacillaceae bacterium]HNU65048.1 glycolate oxidase subunit GlcF [Thiobacillaceae bacterium]
METRLPQDLLGTPEGREAEAILRSCVHCGFCNATCPTYRLLGDELDGPRGRIYLMKQMLEGRPVTAQTRLHLDRCLTCLNCETTCPSGVRYGRLLDIGRTMVEQRAPRSAWERLKRQAVRTGLTTPALFEPALKVGRWVRDWLPAPLKSHVPPAVQPCIRPDGAHARTMLVLEGCVQPGLAPEINVAAARVLGRLGIRLISAAGAGCCGAIDQHMAAAQAARKAMRRNIDAWWPHIQAGVEAIVLTASGCGSLVKEYGHHLRHDPDYRAKAARVSALARDLSEVLAREDLDGMRAPHSSRVAFHPPCSLQHGQQIRGVVEDILARAGFELVPFAEPHLCCGSAGTYALLQPELSHTLRERKLGHIQAARPGIIATANLGCRMHLAAGTDVPVVHWISLLENAASQ